MMLSNINRSIDIYLNHSYKYALVLCYYVRYKCFCSTQLYTCVTVWGGVEQGYRGLRSLIFFGVKSLISDFFRGHISDL